MDNILFFPSVESSDWVRRTVPVKSTIELPVAGRRYIDYAIECARRFGIMFAEIIDWDFSESLQAEYGDLTRTGLALFYLRGEGARARGLAELPRFKTPLTQQIADGLVVVWGLCLSSHGPEDVSYEPVAEAELVETPPGIYKHIGGRWMRILPRGLVVKSIKSWHLLNLSVLNNPAIYTLPGYSAEQGVHLGRNVVMERGTVAKQPLLMQDDSWCARNVVLDGEVIIGSRSFVSEGTVLRRSVVCDDTFIGTGLEIIGKIVVGNRVIDADSGAWIDISENGIVRRIGSVSASVKGVFRAAWHFLQGASRGRAS